jgi:hypothetical protein
LSEVNLAGTLEKHTAIMAIPASALGAAADPRLGDEADAIGKGRQGSVAADIFDNAINHNSQRRGSLIYNDRSITFEDYMYWAARSREYEKTLDTSHAGLAGIFKGVLGKGKHAEHPVQELGANGSDSEKTDEKHAGDAAVGESRYGITEAEWDNAQRAVRTATWGGWFCASIRLHACVDHLNRVDLLPDHH